jgi:large subunit ribosomal protein L25
MAAEKSLLTVERREVLGKKVRALRRSGMIPANIYGQRLESLAVQLPAETLKLLLRDHGRNEIVYLQVDGEERPAFIRTIQKNPVTDAVLHVEFLQVSLTQKVKITVPIHLTGVAPAVETFGGVLVQQLNSVSVEALPTNIPTSIEVDVSVLTELEQALHISDVIPPEGAVILQDPESAVARIATPAAERAEEIEAEEAEAAAAAAEAGEEAPEGEESGEGEGQGE